MKEQRTRNPAIDQLRAIAILGMLFSGLIPFGVLPEFMYHAQLPPPKHEFSPHLSGYTWVDLVFPLFIFAMAYAVPYSVKISKSTIYQIPARYFALLTFAFLFQHFKAHQIQNPPETLQWVFSLLGFGIILVLYSKKFNQMLGDFYKLIFWAILLLSFYWLSTQFEMISLQKSDPIIKVLAHVYLACALLQILVLRWGRSYPILIFSLVVAGFFISREFGLINPPTINRLIQPIFEWGFLDYLLIALPALYLANKLSTNTKNLSLPVVLSLFSILLIGIWMYETPYFLFFTYTITFSLLVISYTTQSKPLFLAAIGMFFGYLCYIGVDGQISKDPTTLSYCLHSLSLAIICLEFFRGMNTHFHIPTLINQTGQNPLLAYILFALFLWPLLSLSGLEEWILSVTNSPYLGIMRALIYTLSVALIVKKATQNNWFLKA
ncbi:MAG: DUF5009 domain-containing protein [Cyclobacteriaceae bacterium]|nr:DUF5009 domain-containing protein [Cyclobacteriaceae bacterium]MCH8516341.1 DUF5009 domain-containing protein [Cyclobacteriaceae bacterium]